MDVSQQGPTRTQRRVIGWPWAVFGVHSHPVTPQRRCPTSGASSRPPAPAASRAASRGASRPCCSLRTGTHRHHRQATSCQSSIRRRQPRHRLTHRARRRAQSLRRRTAAAPAPHAPAVPAAVAPSSILISWQENRRFLGKFQPKRPHNRVQGRSPCRGWNAAPP
eukprot:COSAG01_NODE_3698_length_5784_cov_5.069129_6_plen_165_part_00